MIEQNSINHFEQKEEAESHDFSITESKFSADVNQPEEKITKLWSFWTFIGLVAIFAALLVYWGISSLPEKDTKPSVNRDVVEAKIQKYLLVVTPECRDIAERVEVDKIIAKTDNDIYAVANFTQNQKETLEQRNCVKYLTADKEEAKAMIASVTNILAGEVERDIQESKLEKSILGKDVKSKEDLVKYLQAKHGVTPVQPEQIANYQSYVTPNDQAVGKVANKFNGNEAIYNYGANGWTWISDETLYGQVENWVMPNYFLTVTPSLPSNPVPSHTAGDCEDQANTLTSAIRADGQSAANVRTVLGLVNFNGNIGGHAWVEVYQDNQWIPLDATSGPYYNNGQFVQAQALPYDYFATHEFPVVERWFYYNDQYFTDIEAGTGNAPEHWSQTGTPSFEF